MDSFSVNRRQFLSGIVVSSLAMALPWLARANAALSTVSADQALQWLKEGNERFATWHLQHPNLNAERLAETFSGEQHPFASIIACSDSRVPVEFVFDRGIGDLFVIRVAGNVADTDEIGTSEYGTEHLGTPLLVVLGHTQCGAVTAVVRGDPVGGQIPLLVDNIIPAANRAKAKGVTGDALILEAIKENVQQTINDLLQNSPEIAHRVHSGQLKVVGALYHIENGRVEWL